MSMLPHKGGDFLVLRLRHKFGSLQVVKYRQLLLWSLYKSHSEYFSWKKVHFNVLLTHSFNLISTR